MDRLSQALAQHGTLYHVTDARRLECILAYGLIPGDLAGQEQRDDSRNSHVYLSDRDCAEDYLFAHQGEEELVLLAIDCAELKPWNLGADEQNFGYHGSVPDALDSPRAHESAEQWARRVGLDSEEHVLRSLELGSVAYQGTIDPRAIRVALSVAPPALSGLADLAGPSKAEPPAPSLEL